MGGASTTEKGKEFLNNYKMKRWLQSIRRHNTRTWQSDIQKHNRSYKCLILIFFHLQQGSKSVWYYELNAEIKTNLWNKSFVIIPKTNFNSSNFKINFPLDIFRFERFVDQIDKELVIKSRNPVLTYKCDVHTIAETDVGTIDESFSHSLIVPLQRNVFSINNLSAQKSGSIKRTEKVIIQSSSVAKRNSLAFTIAIFLSLIAFALITKGEPGTKSKLGKIDETEKVVKWIKRKYGDWIVDSDEIPSTEVIISLKSIEDLMKVAEDLGKPVIHKANKGKHLYCVFDNSVQYKYMLSGEETKKVYFNTEVGNIENIMI